MKRTKLFIALVASLMCCLPAQAQLGNLINKGVNAAQKAKQVKKSIDDVTKKVNGDIDFYFGDNHKGFYRSKNGKIVLDDRHADGEHKGKNIIYTIEKNGDVVYDDGQKVGELQGGGIINCRNCSPYVTLAASGDVLMDGEVIGHIDDNGNVTWEGKSIGRAKGLDKQVAAYIFFGIINNKENLVEKRQAIKARAEQARIEAQNRQQQAANAAAKSNAAKSSNATKGSNTKSSNSKKAASKKVQEWSIEKNGGRGYVDANGVVYDWAHKKIGQLPNGSGDIKDGSGNTIGRISMDDIYDRNGNKVATVSSGGTISVPGSNAAVAEVKGGGRIDMTKDSKTLGYCDVRPYEWAVAIIFCDFFKF